MIGCVSPLGFINNKGHLITLFINKELEDKVVLMHANIHTKTISVRLSNLINLIRYINHFHLFITVEIIYSMA